MRRLITGRLSSNWSKLLKSLFRDLAPLGHSAKRVSKGRYQITLAEIGDFAPDQTGRISFYDAAHEISHDTPTTPAAPPPPASTLAAESLAAKEQIESWMTTPNGGPYRFGLEATPETPAMSAEQIQAFHRDLIRGEQAGASEPLPTPNVVDIDLPVAADRYDIASIPGSHMVRAAERDAIDYFANVAHDLGIGQQKFSRLVAHGLTELNHSPERWTAFAYGIGLSEQQVQGLMRYYNDAVQRFA